MWQSVRAVVMGIFFALCGTVSAQLVACSEYFRTESDGAYSNVTWSVRVSTECKRQGLIRTYEASITGAPSSSRLRVMQQQPGGTNWTALCSTRSDLFGFLDLSRTRHWRMKQVALGKVPACPDRLALVSREGVLAVAPLEAPQRQSISGALVNTGADASAAGTVLLSVTEKTLQFRVFLIGMSAQYTLWINDVPCGTYATSAGRVEVGSYPEGAPPFSEVKRFAITDDAGTEVLAAQIY